MLYTSPRGQIMVDKPVAKRLDLGRKPRKMAKLWLTTAAKIWLNPQFVSDGPIFGHSGHELVQTANGQKLLGALPSTIFLRVERGGCSQFIPEL
jgi:hypothetical protein